MLVAHVRWLLVRQAGTKTEQLNTVLTPGSGRALSCTASMSEAVGVVGRHVPAFSSRLRPDALLELGEWGGQRLVRGKRVLDLGCGDGRFALAIARSAAAVEGLDPDPTAISAARRNGRKRGAQNVRFRSGAAQELPYRDATFDVVILSWTL